MKSREFQGITRKRPLGFVAVIALLTAYLWPILCYVDLVHEQGWKASNPSFGTISVDCLVDNSTLLRSDSRDDYDCISPEDVTPVVTKKSSGNRTIVPEPATFSTVDTDSLHLQSFGPLYINRQNLLHTPQTSLFAAKVSLLFYD